MDNVDAASPEAVWSMKLLPKISDIFKRPGYPKHHPNTVLPMCSTVMNLTYDVLEHAILSNPFHTAYFAWIDIGYFRDDSPEVPCYRIGVPPGFDERKVAMNRVSAFIVNRSAETIVKENDVWVSGNIMFGRKELLLKFIRQYRETAESVIERGWYSTDQQTVFSMFADHELGVNLSVQLRV